METLKMNKEEPPDRDTMLFHDIILACTIVIVLVLTGIPFALIWYGVMK